MVQTVKRILKKSEDPHLAILSYRATPMPWCGLSPSELSMGRKIRTTVPQTTEHLIPKWPYLPHFLKANTSFKGKQKKEFDSRHRVKEQVEISEGSDVWITTNGQRLEGQVAQSVDTPRSYVIVTLNGELRRNRTQLNVAPTMAPTQETTEQSEQLDSNPNKQSEQVDSNPNEQSDLNLEVPRRIMTRSQTGTMVRPPERLTYT